MHCLDRATLGGPATSYLLDDLWFCFCFVIASNKNLMNLESTEV